MSAFKLYYTPPSCGGANYIVAHYAGVPFDSEQVDLYTKRTASGADYLSINPKGNVPAIILPCGALLNENVGTITYLADQNPEAGLIPPPGTVERYKFLNALGFVASELHQSFSAVFKAEEQYKDELRKKAVQKSIRFVKLFLGDKPFIMGDQPTAVDFYAYNVHTWAGFLGIDLAGSPKGTEYMNRVAELPGVKEAQEKMQEQNFTN